VAEGRDYTEYTVASDMDFYPVYNIATSMDLLKEPPTSYFTVEDSPVTAL
jgi:hypothetical protein